MIKVLFATLAALPLTACVAELEEETAVATSEVQSGVQEDLATARAATAKYHRLDAALADGYADSGLPCIDGQGYHYINGSLLGTYDPAQPHLLVYFPQPNGELKLVGLEWIEPIVDETTTPPEMFGHTFHGPVSVAGVPFDFFALHVWAWKHNKAGMFAGKDPSLVCP